MRGKGMAGGLLRHPFSWRFLLPQRWLWHTLVPQSTSWGWLAQKAEHSAAWISGTLDKYLETYLGEVGWIVIVGIAVVPSTHSLTPFWMWCSLAAGLQCAQEGTGEVRDILVSASFRPQLPGLPRSLPCRMHPFLLKPS
jgi:hypothetical protein